MYRLSSVYIFFVYRISQYISDLYIFLYVPYLTCTYFSCTVSHLYIFFMYRLLLVHIFHVPYLTCTYFSCTVSHLYIFLYVPDNPLGFLDPTLFVQKCFFTILEEKQIEIEKVQELSQKTVQSTVCIDYIYPKTCAIRYKLEHYQ